MPQDSLCIYGDVGTDWWTGEGIDEHMVLDGLKELDPKASSHKIRINSPGGSVQAGLGILTLLRSHKESMKALNPDFKLETTCDGYTMSSASVIFMAGDIRTICLGGIVMIHDAWCPCYGNAAEMRKTADTLDQMSQNCANIYAALCSPAPKDSPVRDSSSFRALMKEETYFIGDEAVNYGLATQQDLNSTASLHASLSPGTIKQQGGWVNVMTRHYQKRTFKGPSAAKSILDAKLALQRLSVLEAGLLDPLGLLT